MTAAAVVRSGAAITVRLASDEDGPRIGELAVSNGFGVFEDGVWEMDWSQVAPSWLVAEEDGKIIGAIQVLIARPIGRIEMLFMDTELSLRGKHRVVKLILDAGLTILRQNGVYAVMTSVPSNLERYRDVLKDEYNGVDMSDGWIMGARLG